jgi:hypothetical protein
MIRLLALIVVIQLGAVIVLYWPEEPRTSPMSALIANQKRSDVRSISITDADEQSIRISRDNESWQLASGLPVNANKIDTLLASLLDRDPGFAIANSEGAAQRFDVSEEDFERRIVLDTGDEAQTIYLGSSPAFRKVHARREGDSAIYVLELNSYDAPTDRNSWLDKGLLAIRNQQRMTLNGLTLRLEKDSWVRENGEAVQAEAMETLLTALAGLQVSGIEERGIAEAKSALSITASGGDQDQGLEILEDVEGGRYFLRSDRYQVIFATSAYDAERIIEAAKGLSASESAAIDADENVTPPASGLKVPDDR